jgi:hypothetical protein
MAENTRKNLNDQVNQLIGHIAAENPELLSVVKGFRRLDKIAYKLGLLRKTESFATEITWWPLISVLGTFSSGKSTFINQMLGQSLQATGNQAVDSKFTVICYGPGDTPYLLPGIALDSDPRFPFYKISREIDEVIAGEGQRLDSYIQLKTCNSEQLRGKIIIDSPGFDADAQRTSTLRITDHIIDLSDLVLVFFDARHPEPGAMRDTLEYLVANTLHRADFNKFVHILNQIDNAAREDNPEEVFAAWQRALAQNGLTAGRFYRIYDPSAAAPIEDESLRQRFEAKRDEDMAAIMGRIAELEIERSYRVTGKLEQTAKAIRDQVVPRLELARRTWRRRLLWLDSIVFGTILLLLVFASVALGYWQGLSFTPPGWLASIFGSVPLLASVIAVLAIGAWQLHRLLRDMTGRAVLRQIRRDESLGEQADAIARAFEANLKSWRPLTRASPRGWGFFARREIDSILSEAHRAIQTLNDRFADPSGKRAPARAPSPLPQDTATGSKPVEQGPTTDEVEPTRRIQF